MNQSELEISVMDGARLVQRWVCARATMPDGAPGVLWRGVLYRLLDGDCIDVAAPAEPLFNARFTVLPGEEATWVLLQGMPEDLERARIALQASGVDVSRTGRWLGDPVAGVGFDWFLRCEGRVEPVLVAGALPDGAGIGAAPDPALRIALLERRVSELLAEKQVDIRLALEKARQPILALPPVPQPRLETPPDLEWLRAELDAAQARIAELEAALAATPPLRTTTTAAPLKLHDELATALTAFRPDIVLVRDSLRVMTGEFTSRVGVYRALQELPVASGQRPGGGKWKTLQLVDRWVERHVSTGQADDARAYARFEDQDRQWHILLGWKTEQARDIQWLARQ